MKEPSEYAALSPATRLGDAGRNVGRGPGLADWDASLFKNVRVARRFGDLQRAVPVRSFQRVESYQLRVPNFDLHYFTATSTCTQGSVVIWFATPSGSSALHFGPFGIGDEAG